jgi:hypothetical protein
VERFAVVEGVGQLVVWSVPALFADTVADATAAAWLALWQELSTERPALQVPVRLLEAAVAWRPKRDRRVLLRLPDAERRVLEQMLAEVTRAPQDVR